VKLDFEVQIFCCGRQMSVPTLLRLSRITLSLTPGCRSSGENNQRLGHITKAGSGMARWVLGQASKHIFRTEPSLRAWFKKIKRKKGSKIARVAVMRRIATIIWHMPTKRKTYAEIRSLGIGLQE
jgi:transposase